MKAKELFSTNGLAALVLACLAIHGVTACSSDEDEPSVEELLSDKTTPVTFELKAGYYHLFDFAGSHYVGSDTIEEYHGRPADIYRVEVDLRQGRHHLVWFTGLDGFSYSGKNNIRFNPETKTVESSEERNIKYAECDVNVVEYLLPTQKLEFTPLTAKIEIEIFDYLPQVEASLDGLPLWQGNTIKIGTIKGYPFITSVSLDDNKYTLSDDVRETSITSYSYYKYDTSGGTVSNLRKLTEVSVKENVVVLCPKNGLDNIQLIAEVTGTDGKSITTSIFPKISVRRGQVTKLRGNLFDANKESWMVTMEPFE